jgi:hypothetical protein
VGNKEINEGSHPKRQALMTDEEGVDLLRVAGIEAFQQG